MRDSRAGPRPSWPGRGDVSPATVSVNRAALVRAAAIRRGTSSPPRFRRSYLPFDSFTLQTLWLYLGRDTKGEGRRTVKTRN